MPLVNLSTADWHALPPEQALAALESSQEGVTGAEARARLARFGPNRLPPPKGRSALARFFAQFHNLLIYVLLGAAALTGLFGHWVDALVILGVVLVNAVIGFVQEGKAEQAIAGIRRMLSLRALVVRDGIRSEIDAEGLVAGDIVLVASGDRVPADLRLLNAKSLRAEEAALTGESLPVDKSPAAVAADAALGDRLCMLYSGTLVVNGRGKGVVVATGGATQIGRISTLLAHVEEVSTPLIAKLDAFAGRLTLFILAASVALFLFGWQLRGFAPDEMFLVVAGLAVSAIPEGLPAILTITLAIGVQKMARRRAIVRRLPAVETLGAVTVICTDKTGTLTRDEMTVQRVVLAGERIEVTGAGYAPHGEFLVDGRRVALSPALVDLARAGLLCNESCVSERDGQWMVDGDPTEGALLTLAMKAGLRTGEEAAANSRLDIIPFESERQYMATLHATPEQGARIYLKGAPERVLAACNQQRDRVGLQPLDVEFWRRELHATAEAGMRVLAIASKPASPGQRTLDEGAALSGFTLLGLTGMIDPPREEAVAAIAACRQAGIRVKMITGDHAVTAQAIGRRFGLGGDGAVVGAALASMSPETLRHTARTSDVFARVSPEHKLALVEALQAGGEICAMTGDGVNDAPALKRADVGVAMGRKGTEAAKEAADMVIADDNFASIAAAVEEGRAVHDNIKKAILYILPTNGGEIAAIVVAVLFGMALPITALQILWINMVTEVTLSVTLAFEAAEDHVMRRPPRSPDEPLISWQLVRKIGFVSLLLFAGTMGLFLWQLDRGASLGAARAAAVNALVVGEIAYLFNSRFLTASSLSWRGLTGNRWVLVASGGLLLLQLALTYLPPMQRLFGTAALDAAAWAVIGAFGAVVFLLVELEKAVAAGRGRAG